MKGTAYSGLINLLKSTSYTGPLAELAFLAQPFWAARAVFRPIVDGSVPHTQHVNFGIVCKKNTERRRHRPRGSIQLMKGTAYTGLINVLKGTAYTGSQFFF
jgi:hypothetical protein